MKHLRCPFRMSLAGSQNKLEFCERRRGICIFFVCYNDKSIWKIDAITCNQCGFNGSINDSIDQHIQNQ